MINLCSLYFIPVFFLISTALAAENNSDNIAKIRIASLAIIPENESIFFVSKDATVVECKLNTRTLSDEYQIPFKDSEIRLYLDRSAAEKRTYVKPMISLNLKSSDHWILFFVPIDHKYTCIPLVDSKAPFGSITIYNCTSELISYKTINQKKTFIQSRNYGILQQNNQNDIPIMIYYETTKNEAKLIRNTVWQIANDQREFVFLYGKTGKFFFHHLVNFNKKM